MPDIGDEEVQVFTPEGFEGPPVSAADLLKRGRAILAEEGRWMQGNWFTNAHPEVDPEDAFCNNWQVCADGAIAIASYGVKRRYDSFYNEDTGDQEIKWGPFYALTDPTSDLTELDLIVQNARYLLKQASEAAVFEKRGYKTLLSSVVTYNDNICETRTEMLGIFDRAIALAEESSNG